MRNNKPQQLDADGAGLVPVADDVIEGPTFRKAYSQRQHQASQQPTAMSVLNIFCCQEDTSQTVTQLHTMVAITSNAESLQMALHQSLVKVVPASSKHDNDTKQQQPSSSSSPIETETIITPSKTTTPLSPSSSKKRARYSVHFNPQEPVHIQEIPSRAQLHKYWKRLYITKQDQVASQQEILHTLRAYVQEQQKETTEGVEVDLDERIRGLEAFLPQDEIRAKRMKEAIQLILTRQETQTQASKSKQTIILDTAWLETSYKPFSEAASVLAHRRGIKDLQAVPASWRGGAPTKSVMIR